VIIHYHFAVTTIVRSDRLDGDELDELRSRVVELEATLVERSAEVARVTSDLEAFRARYRHEVGTLHEQLDKLELAIAEAELGELSKLVAGGPSSPSEPSAPARPSTGPRFTSDAVRKLFRDVAKAVHPDLARDDSTRHRRHTLMAEANRAYELGDEEQLRLILQAWEKSPEAVLGSDPAAIRLRLARRVAQIEEHLELLAADLAVMTTSPLWELKKMVDDAAAKGRDLVRDMVKRLKRDIMAATNRLDAMRPPA